MTPVFLHGWGFDASMWDGLMGALRELPALPLPRGERAGVRGARAKPDRRAIGVVHPHPNPLPREGEGFCALDRGYFASPCGRSPSGPSLAIGHSLGALLLLRDPPQGTRALVAVNGFDRFVEDEHWPGTPRRVLDRMIARFDDDPAGVLGAFRTRCGAPTAPPIADAARLGDDLRLLRDADARPASAAWRLPLLVLHGRDDPVLPPALRDRVFAGAPDVERLTCPGGGHLLPVTHADWCAARIAAFAGRIA